MPITRTILFEVFHLELAKNMIKPPLIWLIYIFDFIGWLSNYVAFDKIKWFCAFTKYTTKIYDKATIHVNELILTPFSPFDIKCKIMWKTSGIVYSGHLGGWVFHIFPRLHSIMCVCVFGRGGTLDTFESFRGSRYNIQFKLYATSKMELSAGNCCWQLLRRSLS